MKFDTGGSRRHGIVYSLDPGRLMGDPFDQVHLWLREGALQGADEERETVVRHLGLAASVHGATPFVATSRGEVRHMSAKWPGRGTIRGQIGQIQPEILLLTFMNVARS